jgi:phospholipid/cholesterol/gamma-HCH transport system substrate-binding protein
MALGIAVVLVALFGAYIAWISVNGPPFQNRYKLDAVVASDSPVLKSGTQVREAGKLAGIVTGVQPEGNALRISMELRPQFAPVGQDASARVRVRSIVYLTYVEVDPGNRDNPMPDGGTIPLARTGSGVDLLQVVQLFDRRTREVLRRSLLNTGQGLAGRGDDLNAALAVLNRTLQAGIPELEALTQKPGAIAATIQGGSRVASGLTGRRPDDVGALVGSGASALGAVARQRAALGRSVELLRPFEDQVLKTAPLANPVLDDAAGLATKLAPAVRKLSHGLPQVNRLLALGQPLREETNRLTDLIDPVVTLAAPPFAALYTPVAALEPILTQMRTTVDALAPYSADFARAGKWVASATTRSFPEGQTAPNNPVLRVFPVFSCNRGRDPYPKPGQALKDSQPC